MSDPRNDEIVFRSACPGAKCDDTNVYRWYHSSCSSSSYEYLNYNAKIRCGECGETWDFFDTTFICDDQNNKKHKSDLKRAIYCFSSLMMANKLSPDFLNKICESLKTQAKDKGLPTC